MFESCAQVHEHSHVPDHESRTGGGGGGGGGGGVVHRKGDVNKPSDSDSHGEESWVSWDSWVGWGEAEDPRRTGRHGESKDRRARESKGGSTEESYETRSEEHSPGEVQEPGRKGQVWRGCVEFDSRGY